MAANINDKFSKVSTGIRPKTTAVAGVRAPSGTTLTCDDLTGWTTDTAVHFVTYKADAQGKVVPGSQTDFKGIVSGNSIINLTVTGGNDNGNAVGDIVQALPTAGFAKDLADGLMVSHNQDGTLKPNVVNTQAIADDAVTSTELNITPFVDANGWTVLDYGGFKECLRTVVAFTSATSIAAAATTVAPQTTGITAPVGVTNMADVKSFSVNLNPGTGTWAAAVNFDGTGMSGTTLPTVIVRNLHGVSVSFQNVRLSYRVVI